MFRRLDLPEPVDIPASALNVTETMLGTTLEHGDAKVGTVEHLMSAMAGLGVDNAFVDLTAAEVPIMDGSAAPFVFLLQSAGIEEQNAPKRFVTRAASASRSAKATSGCGSTRTTASASTSRSISIIPRCASTARPMSMDFSTSAFLKEISRARTFGFLKDLEGARARERALGGSLDNAIVMDDYRVINEDGLRFRDEFVRHKVLDALGDLYLRRLVADRRVLGLQVRPPAQQSAARARCSRRRTVYEAVVFDEGEQRSPVSYQLAPSHCTRARAAQPPRGTTLIRTRSFGSALDAVAHARGPARRVHHEHELAGVVGRGAHECVGLVGGQQLA